jgi:hypothetical protein
VKGILVGVIPKVIKPMPTWNLKLVYHALPTSPIYHPAETEIYYTLWCRRWWRK